MRTFKLGMFAIFSFLFLFAVLPPVAAHADGSSAASSIAIDHAFDKPVAAVGAEQAVQQSTVSKILEVLPDWLQALSVLIAAAASITALTPTPKDDGALLYLRKIIDFLALNVGGAKNASAVKTSNDLR
jgi:hypothetical protein